MFCQKPEMEAGQADDIRYFNGVINLSFYYLCYPFLTHKNKGHDDKNIS